MTLIYNIDDILNVSIYITISIVYVLFTYGPYPHTSIWGKDCRRFLFWHGLFIITLWPILIAATTVFVSLEFTECMRFANIPNNQCSFFNTIIKVIQENRANIFDRMSRYISIMLQIQLLIFYFQNRSSA